MRTVSSRATCDLVLLCVVQGCERFAFFATLPFFVIYLRQRHGFRESIAMALFGIFQALSYLGALPAGIRMDRGLGRSAATMMGCALLLLGYSALALDRRALLWAALACLVAGHSFFKPGISALASQSAASGRGRPERAFLLLHLAVNLGALTGPLCSEWCRAWAGWPAIFLCAAAGMFFGTFPLTVAWGRGEPKAPSQPPRGPTSIFRSDERERTVAVWLICGVATIFWLTAQQAGSSLALFAEIHTQQVLTLGTWRFPLGPGYFASLHGLFVLLLLPLSLRAGADGVDPGARTSLPAKMVWGYVATAGAFALLGTAGLRGGDTGRVSPLWLSGCYLLLSIAEVRLAPLGLALVTRLAPPRIASRAHGLFFATVALGSGLAGALGLLWESWPHHRYFALLAFVSLGAAVVLLARLRALNAVLRRAAWSSASPNSNHPSGGLS
jgi:POT family proton-dependent oligopeptide transporter